jgi:hypothetical protein
MSLNGLNARPGPVSHHGEHVPWLLLGRHTEKSRTTVIVTWGWRQAMSWRRVVVQVKLVVGVITAFVVHGGVGDAGVAAFGLSFAHTVSFSIRHASAVCVSRNQSIRSSGWRRRTGIALIAGAPICCSASCEASDRTRGSSPWQTLPCRLRQAGVTPTSSATRSRKGNRVS